MKDRIVECNVWCSASDQNRNLGLPDGDCWMPISIDFGSVLTIKEAGENEFIGKGKATIYIPGQHFIVDIDYKDAVIIWRGIEL